MKKARVAKKLDESIWVDNEGNQTEESKANGRKTKHILIRPDMVIFVEEVGRDTSQEGDGAVGGQKKIVQIDTIISLYWGPQQQLESLLCTH